MKTAASPLPNEGILVMTGDELATNSTKDQPVAIFFKTKWESDLRYATMRANKFIKDQHNPGAATLAQVELE